MNVRALVIAAIATAVVSARAAASPLVVVVREGSDDALAVARLRGQLADLDVTLTVERGAVEPALDVQLASAARLAVAGGARAVVWFIPHGAPGGGLSVAVATPGDHRLFVREIPAADPSAVAEAAAVAARGAIRALGEGGTIGVEVAPSALAPAAPPRFGLELAVGWQVALDAGADVGAQAIAQRTCVTRGRWAGALALTLGPALRHAGPEASVELSRSTAALAIERRVASLALAVSAGAALYHRATVATSGEFSATPATTTIAAIAGAELRWRWRPGAASVGIDAVIGVDIVPGAPELAVARGAAIDALDSLRMVQPRFSLSIVAGLP